jgi:lysyl-tRNA synthetase class 2
MLYSVSILAVDALKSSEGTKVALSGRVLGYRRLGGVSFGHIVDESDTKIQFSFNKREIGPEKYAEWSTQPHIGDIVALSGKMGVSSTGEKTVFVTDTFAVVAKTHVPFPDKFHGVVDEETIRRKRWLHCMVDPSARATFRKRAMFLTFIREFLERREFMECETPILSSIASGAQARPFKTHHNALDADMFLRIAPETYLKRMVAAGFDRVYELGRQFRNEGMDPSHLQEFTSLEWYISNANYITNYDLFQSFLSLLFTDEYSWNIRPDTDSDWTIPYGDTKLVFGNPETGLNIQTVQYVDLFAEHGKNPLKMDAKEADSYFKTEIRPNLIQPVFVMDYPAHMSPMAARCRSNTALVEQWQFIVNGWELVKCYTELTDPTEQRELLEAQMAARTSGDDEAMMLEEDFLDAMNHGMPPMSGLGMGVDRFVALLTNQQNLRDVVFFPTVVERTP